MSDPEVRANGVLVALDVVQVPSLHPQEHVVLIDPDGRKVLVPVSWVVEDDDERFTKTFRKAAYRSVSYLDGKEWSKTGRLERRWLKLNWIDFTKMA